MSERGVVFIVSNVGIFLAHTRNRKLMTGSFYKLPWAPPETQNGFSSHVSPKYAVVLNFFLYTNNYVLEKCWNHRRMFLGNRRLMSNRFRKARCTVTNESVFANSRIQNAFWWRLSIPCFNKQLRADTRMMRLQLPCDSHSKLRNLGSSIGNHKPG